MADMALCGPDIERTIPDNIFLDIWNMGLLHNHVNDSDGEVKGQKDKYCTKRAVQYQNIS